MKQNYVLLEGSYKPFLGKFFFLRCKFRCIF